MGRLQYWRRIVSAYLLPGTSNLSFWHEQPAVHEGAVYERLGPYYMTFADKATYAGPFDRQGVPQLDYHGTIGLQYNPIVTAQYGLAQYNRYKAGDAPAKAVFLRQADWLVDNLEANSRGLKVWNHHFDFDYRETLRAPWYSGLAQGQGLSLLARADAETGDPRYRTAMDEVYATFERETADGGVRWTAPDGDVWLEEYVVSPPTHILNGFMWTAWGLWDYHLASGGRESAALFAACARTLAKNLPRYDTGFWSLYELSGTFLPMIASPFYHGLHIVQLEVMRRMTGLQVFGEFARRWEGYRSRPANRARSYAQKCAFKLLYY